MRHFETLWVTLSHFESLWVTLSRWEYSPKNFDLNSICLKQRVIEILLRSFFLRLEVFKKVFLSVPFTFESTRIKTKKKYILFVSSIFESPWIKISKRYILFVSCVFESPGIKIFKRYILVVSCKFESIWIDLGTILFGSYTETTWIKTKMWHCE